MERILFLTGRLAQHNLEKVLAGMEPPPDAVLRNGWYVYTPKTVQPARLMLTRSEFTADFELCVNGRCQPMGHWLPSDGNVTEMTACERAASR